MILKDKKILLGVCGGIAAYKACEVLRLLQKQGADVTVVMTPSAAEFVAPLTFEALSQNTVHIDLFSGADRGIAHIELVKQNDYMLILPASADSIAKLAQGHANDLLSTVALAFNKVKWIAPAMNTRMWQNTQTQTNLQALKLQGYMCIEPDSGNLACQEVGEGKLASEQDIVSHLIAFVAQEHSLQGKKVVITAGPTREYIDAVRFLSSPATGSFGVAIAKQAQQRGAQVTLIHGPIQQSIDFPCEVVSVTSAQDMFEAAQQHMDYDYLFSSAAVADYTPAQSFDDKRKKSDTEWHVEFKRTQDILHFLGQHKKPNQCLIGFCAETNNLEQNAKQKMQKKNTDYMVANEVFRSDKGFGNQSSSVIVFAKNNKQTTFNNMSKTDLADKILALILDEL